jgi:hypothetical protein
MKLTFQGDSLAEIHQQIVAAADELTREDVKQPDIKFNGVKSAAEISEAGMDRWADAQPSIKAMQDSALANYNIPSSIFPPGTVTTMNDKTIEQKPFAQPQADGNVPAGTQNKTIDGYTVSSGQVWLPVEGRGSGSYVFRY